MSNIRIAQQLSQGYNPDGTPGTVSTGLPGPAGPPPTDDQVLAAVGAYLNAHPATATVSGNVSPLTTFGAGASGAAGAYVGLGDNRSTVAGYVVAGGSTADVDLHLLPKGAGSVYLDGPVVSSSTVTASSYVTTSDRRLKSEITELRGALEEVRTTPAYRYRMSGQVRRGLLADEAPADVRRQDATGLQMLDLYDLVGTLWAAVRELAEQHKGMEQTCRCQPIR